MHRPIIGTLAVAAVLLVPAPVVAQSRAKPAIEQESPEVRSLVLRGVKHVDRTQLEQTLATKPSACKSLLLQPFCWFTRSPTFVQREYLDRTEFRRDVLRIRVFYWERGYRDVTVDTSITAHRGGGVNVNFDVHEGQPTRIARLSVVYDSTILSDRQRRKAMLIHAGDPLSLVRLDSTRMNLQDAMWDAGYGDALVDTTIRVDSATKSGLVSLTIFPHWKTFVGPVVVNGNSQVKTATILSLMTLKPGDLFRRSELLESQRGLYESNLFRQARISTPAGTDSIKPLIVDVIEAPLRDARLSGGVNNVDFFQLDGRFTHYNFTGGARRLDLAATVSNLLAPQLTGRSIFRDIVSGLEDDPQRYLQPTWDASANFTVPAFLGRTANSFGTGVFAHRRSAPGIFIDRGYGVTATFTRNIAPRIPISLNYRYEITRLEASDVYYCVSFAVCDTATMTTMRSHQAMSPIVLTGFADHTDVPFNPSTGYLYHLDLEHASRWTGSDYRYNRAFFDGATYMHFATNRHVLALHLKLGLVRPLAGGGPSGVSVLHPRKRFYAGGAQSVRGYAENQLGPRILTVPEGDLRGWQISPDPNDPTRMDTVATRCTSADVTQCDPNVDGLRDRDFTPQPLGGTSLAEGSVEFRFPLYMKLDGAVFVDGAVVGEQYLHTLSDVAALSRGTGAVTPGFGVRYRSPVGPIRVDVGINPRITENLPVVTAVDENGQKKIVPLHVTRAYTSGGPRLLDRLVLHLSVGQAF